MTPRRSFIFCGLMLSCGGSGTAGSGGTVETPGGPGGPFEGPGLPGAFAANAGTISDVVGKYGNGGPFESQGASGPFVKQGPAPRSASESRARLPTGGTAAATPAVRPVLARLHPTPRRSTNAYRAVQTLDAVQSSCIRTFLDPDIACYLSATLSCDRNGAVSAEGCPILKLSNSRSAAP